jgi:5-methylcytosine-specific restriction endonuclease McrA
MKHLREKSALAQSHHCFYCGLPVWEKEPEVFAAMHKLSFSQAMLLRCTAEHLQSRSEGGADISKNIVAACTYCNGHRHKRKTAPAPSVYREFVRRRMQRGKWLVAILPEQFVIRESVLTTKRNT